MHKTKRKKAFTLAEMILVMILIGVLFTVVGKVISKNMENKIQVYLFGVYNELQNAAGTINTALLNNPENKNKNIEDVMLQTDAISYCNAFASNVNTYDSTDCVQGTSQFMISKDVQPFTLNTYQCERTYKYNVNSNGLAIESYTPSQSPYTQDISQYSGIYQNLINDSAKVGEKYYNCTKTTEELPQDEKNEVGEFKLEQQITNRAFVSSNNISFYFIATSSLVDNSYFEKNIYKYTANVEQDAICDAASTGNSSSDNSYKRLFIYEPYRISGGYGSSTNVSNLTGKLNQIRFGSASSANVGIFKAQRNVNVCGDSWQTVQNNIPTNLYSNDKCQTFFNIYEIYGSKMCCIYAYSNQGVHPTTERGYVRGKGWTTYTVNPYCYERICTSTIPCVQMPSTSSDPNSKASSSFYNKWKNYFSRYYNNNKFYKAGVKLNNIDEGQKESQTEKKGTSSLTYPNHFIYVSIDTPFKLGTFGKDVFAFEHFDSKIIPLGALANDKNSPLKFNVITRDINSKKITRLNNEPLNFCEAMKYTGEKFSPYCECKDDKGYIIKQYPNPSPECSHGFGCVLRPIKPNISRFKEKNS